MSTISDDVMRDILATARGYTAVLLCRTTRLHDPDAGAVIREHGRRNLSLRADGVLRIVCPVLDDSPWAGIGIFDATVEDTKRLMDDDPAIKAGILTYEVHPVRSFPGDFLSPSA